MKKLFEMTQEDLDRLYEAFKPVPYMIVGGMEPLSPQARANDAWRDLGGKMGFDWTTVEPASQGDRFFFAVPMEATSVPTS